MGAIKERLRAVALFGNTEEKMLDQLDYAGEAIESEFDNIYTRFNNLNDNRIKDYNDLRERDKGIEGLKKDVLDLFEMLAQRTKRIEALEEEVWLLRSDLKYVSSYIPAFDKEPVPTNKDKPKFIVGDTIALSLWGGEIRIVLGIEPDRGIELLDIRTGDRWWTKQPLLYVLVYRPKPPGEV